ncbi:InlB B-repeat-containing protein [Carboxylicivirga sp. N1Y90]|uniref:InlB B-repeat-containing protein n=1 Tax=Carboxylicivirga fragile TaxID=3417571 RepID=UPI003D357D89|nr:T9SS type A sorting domain-containing protein [Marinilabiliaceae bacterium N1Y90]
MKKLFTLLIVVLSLNMNGQNFVPNFDFEGGADGWTNSGADSRQIVSPGNNGSTNAYEVVAAINKGAQYITDGTTQVAIGDYELSFWAKGTIGELAKFKVKFKDGSTKTVNGTAFEASDSWEFFTTTVSLDAALNIDKFILQSNSDLGAGVSQTFVADDLFFGTRATYNLSKTITGAGTITPASDDLPQNSVQTITAVPYLGYEFTSWGGDLSGTTNPTTLTMDGDKSISATFTKIPGFTYEWNFNTNGDLEGWEAYTNCDIEVVNGSAVMTMTGNWPRFQHDKLGVMGDEFDIFEVRLKNNTIYDVDSEAPLKFVFVDPDGNQRSNIIPNTTANDTEFKTYRVLLGGHEYWNGNIASFLIMGPAKLADPVNAGTVEIDYIKLLKGNDDATLSSLTSSLGTLVPGFSSGVHDYTLTVPNGTTVVNFSATATDNEKATVTIRQVTDVNGEEVAVEIADGNADVSSGSGKVSVRVEAENGAKLFYTVIITVDNATAINDNLSGLSIYPNPVKSMLYIDSSDLVSKVEIYSLSGQKVLDVMELVDGVDVAHLPNGIYIAALEVNGEKVIKKFTKK